MELNVAQQLNMCSPSDEEHALVMKSLRKISTYRIMDIMLCIVLTIGFTCLIYFAFGSLNKFLLPLIIPVIFLFKTANLLFSWRRDLINVKKLRNKEYCVTTGLCKEITHLAYRGDPHEAKAVLSSTKNAIIKFKMDVRQEDFIKISHFDRSFLLVSVLQDLYMISELPNYSIVVIYPEQIRVHKKARKD